MGVFKTLKRRLRNLKRRFTMSNRRKENLRHTWKHRHNYLRAFLQGKKFKPNMSNKEHKRLYNLMLDQQQIKEGMSNRKKAIDELCRKLEDKPSLTANEKIELKEYCISKNNLKVEKVNLNQLNIRNIQNENESLNLPTIDPLANARESLDATTALLQELNDILENSHKTTYILEQRNYLKERESVLEKMITDIRDYTDGILKVTRNVNSDNSRQLKASAEELRDVVDSIYEEIDRILDYNVDQARLNLQKGIQQVKQNKYRNLTNAVHALKKQSKPKVQNIALLGNYAEALQQFYARQRASRVRRASQGSGGGRTRKH